MCVYGVTLKFFFPVLLNPLHMLSQVWGLVCAPRVGERLGCCLVSVAGQESPYLKDLIEGYVLQ